MPVHTLICIHARRQWICEGVDTVELIYTKRKMEPNVSAGSSQYLKFCNYKTSYYQNSTNEKSNGQLSPENQSGTPSCTPHSLSTGSQLSSLSSRTFLTSNIHKRKPNTP